MRRTLTQLGPKAVAEEKQEIDAAEAKERRETAKSEKRVASASLVLIRESEYAEKKKATK